ncbi:hypothetical protein C0J52_00236 [Blattella germanica]|nr:hypothetical protein C0J52_00236 [Blattella germanica]
MYLFVHTVGYFAGIIFLDTNVIAKLDENKIFIFALKMITWYKSTTYQQIYMCCGSLYQMIKI